MLYVLNYARQNIELHLEILLDTMQSQSIAGSYDESPLFYGAVRKLVGAKVSFHFPLKMK